ADRTIPVDSKFPLDNYIRLVDAETDDERQLAERQFGRDVKQHIDAIAAKYIRPDEGTYDFAFMYIPVEGVYYELACGKTGALLSYAHDRRVFPVSPTTFTAYLQVIALGLRGMQIEEHAHEVMAYVADLRRDFDRFADDFDKVGTHLGHAQSKYHEAGKRLDKFGTKLERAVEEQEELEGETVLELPGVAADAARAFRPASSRHRSITSASSWASASSRTGVTAWRISARPACACAGAQPTSAARTFAESASVNSERISSEQTSTTFGDWNRR